MSTEEKKQEFLPTNDELSETMHSGQEEVEKNPKKFIIEECIPACQELWKKNIYTFMVSDQLNEGVCWIEIIADNLSPENKEILMNLEGEDVIKFSYHQGTVNFGVNSIGTEGQQRLLELAKQFKMQDVPEGEAYLTEESFLTNICGCYEEYDNPNYRYMEDPFESADIPIDKMGEYLIKYDEWRDSIESKPKLRKFDPSKVEKTTEEYAKEHGMIYDEGRVYGSQFDFDKHLNYVKSKNKKY